MSRFIMSRFIAIPVNQGDAFYLKTRRGSVLVDGGRSARSLPYLFRYYTGRAYVDILVATHNDADHANGVLGFLKQMRCKKLRCKEVWLPGRWAQGLNYMLKRWKEVAKLILEGVMHESDRISRVGRENPYLEEYANIIHEIYKETLVEEAEALKCDDQGWPVQIANLLEQAKEEDYGPWNYWSRILEQAIEEDDRNPNYRLAAEKILWYLLYLYPEFDRLIRSQDRLVLGAITAAARIREIALEAYGQRIPVRWFEYSDKPSGGNKWLRPLNAKEITRIPRLIWTGRGVSEGVGFLYFLALTTLNKESLVLWASDDVCPGVLFTSDSDLSGVRLPSANGPIVTVPHHGSAANSAAYSAIAQSSIRDPIWVRSDENSEKRPCRDYLQASGMKFCTLCRNSNRRKQPLRFYEVSRKWVPDPFMYPCSCV